MCLNDGRGTRIDVHTGKSSALDLTIVSKGVAGICEWEIWEESIIGSDHYPVFCKICVETDERIEKREAKWIFSKAKLGKFDYLCEVESIEIDLNQDIEEIDEKFREVVLKAAYLSIPKSKGKMNKKPVPWWSEECSKFIKERNKAFKMLKRTQFSKISGVQEDSSPSKESGEKCKNK